MSDYNKVGLEGNLVADPETLEVNDRRLVKIRIASNRNWKNSNGSDGQSTTFMDVEFWSPADKKGVGSVVAAHHKKGDKIQVEGYLHQQNYEVEGQKRSKLVLIGKEFWFRKLSKEQGNANGNEDATNHYSNEDIPF